MYKQLLYKVFFCFLLCNCSTKTEKQIHKPLLQVYWSGALILTNSAYRDDDGGSKFIELMLVTFINSSDSIISIDFLQGMPSSIKLISRTNYKDFTVHVFRKPRPEYLIIAPKDTITEFFVSEKGDTGKVETHFANMKEIVNYSKMIYYNDEKDSVFLIPKSKIFCMDTISDLRPDLLKRVRNRQH